VLFLISPLFFLSRRFCEFLFVETWKQGDHANNPLLWGWKIFLEDNMKRTSVAAVLLLALGLTTVFGGGTRSRETASGGRVKLTVTVPENLKVIDWETNYQTKLIEEGTNTDLDFVLLPSTDYIQKLNLMVMAGGSELADITMVQPDDAMVYQWGKAGAIMPMTKYYQDPKASATIQERMKTGGLDILPHITSPDGEIYGVPLWQAGSSSEVALRLWMYQPWLDKLGLKAPSTTEEFHTVTKALVTSDLNGNGRQNKVLGPLLLQFIPGILMF
jgi:putative aldouronate transport system substrate-binding protein